MEASLCMIPHMNHGGIVDEEDDELGTPSPSSSSGDSANSIDSCSSELTEDATSSASSSSSSSSSPPPASKDQRSQRQGAPAPPYEMSSLMAQLPFKRGLSMHFQGKSQSFTSLSNVRCLEDLAKPERPYKKRLKPCKSYGAGLDSHRAPHSPNGCSKAISKRPSRGALPAALLAKRLPGFLLGSGRPPVPSHRSSSFSTQTLLFA